MNHALLFLKNSVSTNEQRQTNMKVSIIMTLAAIKQNERWQQFKARNY